MQCNRLADEKSPYLLQHAQNPVDWYPWGEEAFAKARREDKPIFLSVGYSTCHWCHVMERESFEDQAIAQILNQNFVSVKVDREERPDVDKVYMTFVQATTGSGGWPMSVWLTPVLKPFVGGSYFPPQDRWGQPGFKNLLLKIVHAWQNDREKILASSEGVMRHLRQATSAAPFADAELQSARLEETYRQLKASYDPRHGGFGQAPKFPRPSGLDFMLRHHYRTGVRDALEMTVFTLRKMAEGGMHDQLGGGFHRYSVDERWHLPHFEKMLYDQAQLVGTYLDAYQITGDPCHADMARDILDYVRRDMTGEQGEFYSAEDADSERLETPGKRVEGAFYVWRRGEIVEALGQKIGAMFNFHYGVQADGNVRNDPHGEFPGQNVLFVAHSVDETTHRFNATADETRQTLAQAARRLLDVRKRRPPPRLDDKTITAWNGLMIGAFARAGQVLAEEDYQTVAVTAATFVRRRLYDARRGILRRRYRNGEVAIDGYADDYAFLIRGLLDLYETCFDVDWLTWAIDLQRKQDELFWDDRSAGYFTTSGDDRTILLRMKDDYDGAEPSANSVGALNLLRLAAMTGQQGYRERAAKTLAAFADHLTSVPHAMPQMMVALDSHLNPPMRIVVAGRPAAPDTKALLAVVHQQFMPDKVLVLADGGDGQRRLARHIPFIATLQPVDGKATAYVCQDGRCQAPATTTQELQQAIGKK